MEILILFYFKILYILFPYYFIFLILLSYFLFFYSLIIIIYILNNLILIQHLLHKDFQYHHRNYFLIYLLMLFIHLKLFKFLELNIF